GVLAGEAARAGVAPVQLGDLGGGVGQAGAGDEDGAVVGRLRAGGGGGAPQRGRRGDGDRAAGAAGEGGARPGGQGAGGHDHWRAGAEVRPQRVEQQVVEAARGGRERAGGGVEGGLAAVAGGDAAEGEAAAGQRIG